MNWIPLIGKFEVNDQATLSFPGNNIQKTDDSRNNGFFKPVNTGIILCDELLNNGEISTEVTFKEFDNSSSCEFLFNYDMASGQYFTAGINGTSFQPFNIRYFTKNNYGFYYYFSSGDNSNIKSGEKYFMRINFSGSKISLRINNVKVCDVNIPYFYPNGQIGLYCTGNNKVEINNFNIKMIKPKAFIIMQFADEYNDVYNSVIRNVCSEFKIETLRIDEKHETGLIIADIIREITESSLVIADITPINQNVYYEVGYAHGIKKPTILVANKECSLPFDIAGLRVLFYENSIGGKDRFEEGLRKHIESILESYQEI
jgi:hypothetical protein